VPIRPSCILKRAVILITVSGVGATGCGRSSDSPGNNPEGGRSAADAEGGNASGGVGPVDGGDAGCYRDPYLPDNYEPPCDQPKGTLNCMNSWCTIEPGCFIMGDSWCQWYRALAKNNPTQVTLTHRFRIQQFEVTQKQWVAEALPNPSGLNSDGTGDCSDENCPVGNVSWFEALSFANLLSQGDGLQPCYVLENCQRDIGTGLYCDTVRSTYSSVYDCPGYRLPTGAEWEYAARAGTKTTVYTGDIVDTGQGEYTCYDESHLSPIAWYCLNAGPSTHPVGQKQPNDWGLYDVIGNASEWTQSEAATYGAGPFVDWDAELNLSGLLTLRSSAKQTRGGTYFEWANTLHVANQSGAPISEGARAPGIGFRLVQSLSD